MEIGMYTGFVYPDNAKIIKQDRRRWRRWLIDADKLDYIMLYKKNWIRGTGVEAPAI